MKNYFFIIGLLISVLVNAQCDIKTNNKPDGNKIKYFNPKPIIRQSNYEVATAIYKNVTTNKYMVSISVLFKEINPMDVKGDLTIQTTSQKSIVLKLINSNKIKMNGRDLTLALFDLDSSSKKNLENNSLKSLFFKMNGKTYGATITENNSILINELNCL
ncbi:hypothetical protein [Flavobacterium sp. WC2430]|uniref:hypothetical protein n=1 Tax=Flavobacterium sp. WC2430 TaxID=3234137 RepID=UPI0034678F9A